MVDYGTCISLVLYRVLVPGTLSFHLLYLDEFRLYVTFSLILMFHSQSVTT